MNKTDPYFVHNEALCESKSIGTQTQVGAFSHILPGARIGDNCNIRDHVLIESNVIVHDNVTINSGVQLCDGIRVMANVLIESNASFPSDMSPDSNLQTVIQENAYIGANSTIKTGVTVGYNAKVDAGTVVTKDVPPHAVVTGNPAHIINYRPSGERAKHDIVGTEIINSGVYAESEPTPKHIGVGNVSLQPLPAFEDLRGSLMVTDFEENLPFAPRRCFFVHNVPGYNVRGEHAHRECKQFLVAVHGELSIVVDDGAQRKEVRLDSPSVGLYLPPNIWGIQYKFSSDAVLAVFASQPYRASDYIRDYSEFLRVVEKST